VLIVETFTIGQLAHDAGVNIETVRYYERRGLLREPPRSISGYRQYSANDLRRLQFIARAKQLGFTLAEIAKFVGDQDGSETTESVLIMARSKVQELDKHRKELDDTRSRLERLIEICEDPKNEDCAALRVTT
jgi:DNA-binding transcriptional MerR regulator